MSDLTTTQIFATGEKNITAGKMNNIIGGASIQPDFYASKPTASSVNPTDQLLILSGGAYAQAPFSTIVNSVGNSMGPQITAVRLRSFNAIGNPTFEITQRNIGNLLTNPADGTLVEDRWSVTKNAATLGYSLQSLATSGPLSPILLPGTNFGISSRFWRTTLTTQQATLTGTQILQCAGQVIEGPVFRELCGDVHSINLLVRSSVAGLIFAAALRDNASTQSLIKLCTIPTANTWTLITLPNLPIWPSGGSFSVAPGTIGYQLAVCLAAGPTRTAPANDTWQAGNFLGGPGMSNFAASPVNSTFDISYIGHEPGASATTPIDCPFTKNYDDCLRYYQKTYSYGAAVGTVTSNGQRQLYSPGIAAAYGPISFLKIMAKGPTLTLYNNATGAANSVRDQSNIDHASATVPFVADSGFGSISFTTATTAQMSVNMHYTADTGW